MIRADLEAAAFWDRAVCLACSHVQPDREGSTGSGTALDPADEGEPAACEECDGSDVWPAADVLRIAAFVEDEG